jgi:hypothetical protein
LLPKTQSEVRAIDAPPRAWHGPCESSGMDDESRIRYLVQVAAAVAIVVSLILIL